MRLAVVRLKGGHCDLAISGSGDWQEFGGRCFASLSLLGSHGTWAEPLLIFFGLFHSLPLSLEVLRPTTGCVHGRPGQQPRIGSAGGEKNIAVIG